MLTLDPARLAALTGEQLLELLSRHGTKEAAAFSDGKRIWHVYTKRARGQARTLHLYTTKATALTYPDGTPTGASITKRIDYRGELSEQLGTITKGAHHGT